MNSVITVGSLLHFILRWGGWLPLIIGGLCGVIVAAAMGDAPEDSAPISFWCCAFIFVVGIAMEIAAFFVHG